MARSSPLGSFALLLPLAFVAPNEGCSSGARQDAVERAPLAVDPTEARVAYGLALEHCRGGQDDAALEALRRALAGDPRACQRALLEPAFAQGGLRDLRAFRGALEEAAVQHGVSELTLAPEGEAGEWIEVEGLVVDADGHRVAGALVGLFATDDAGRYHPTIDDVNAAERTPRLFAYLVSDAEGHFRFKTVRPGPYPGTRQARHVHVWVHAGERRLAVPHYAVFDDDPLLAEPQNAEQRGEAMRIRMRSGDDAGAGTFDLPFRGSIELPLNG